VRVGPEDVHAWLLHADVADRLASLSGVLSAEEAERAARAATPMERRRRTVRSVWRQCVLARYRGGSPAALRFRRSPLGAVELDPPAGLTFSTSHAGGVSVLVIGRDRRLGIDLEPVSAAARIEEIAKGYLPVERVQRIRRLPPHRRGEEWVRLWTELEACSKRDGRGLGDLTPATAETLLGQTCERVYLRLDTRHAATLVYDGARARLSRFLFDTEDAQECEAAVRHGRRPAGAW
jgi:4'-phosphopantetheinyl transferase